MINKSWKKLLSVLLSVAMLLSLLPSFSLTAAAASPTAAQALVPEMYDGKVSKAKNLLYAGKYWFVIGVGDTGVQLADGAVSKKEGETTLVLLAILNWDSVKFADSDNNDYATSNLRTVMENYVTSEQIGTYYTGSEAWLNDLVAPRTLEGGATQWQTGYEGWQTEDKILGTTITDATLWPLSAAEANQVSASLRHLDHGPNFNLRTPAPFNEGYVRVAESHDMDYINDNYVQHASGVRPALCLNVTADMFVTQVDGPTDYTYELRKHDFGYTASGATLTAQCSSSVCELNGQTFNLTISATDKNYDGNAYTGASISDTTDWTAMGLAVPTIQYEGTGSTTYAKSATAPTDAGTYVATISAGGATASAAFSIVASTPSAYADYLPAATDDATALAAKVVKFNGYDWYMIEDNSTSATAGTVTLLAADTSFGASSFDATDLDNKYSTSMVKTYLDGMTETGGAFADVADAIETVTVTTDNDTDVTAKLYLLSKSEAGALPANVLMSDNFTNAEYSGSVYWLRSPNPNDGMKAAYVDCPNGIIYNGLEVYHTFGVRPALQLDLSKVTFDGATNTFALPTPAHVHSLTPHDAANAGCTTAGNSAYWSCSCGMYFSDENGATEIAENSWVIPALGHNYDNVEYSSDETRHWKVCSRCQEESPFENHTWGSALYVWGDNNSTVTASHGCTVCGKQVSQTVDTTSVVTAAATCTTKEISTFTATFTKDGFTTQTKEGVETAPATGHDFSYAGLNDTIIATCSHNGCEYHSNGAFIVIHAPALTTYGGAESASATLEGVADFNAATGLSISENAIRYYNTKIEGMEILKDGLPILSPAGAGTYWAEIKIQNATAYVVYTIEKTDPIATAPTGVEATYGDTLSDVTLTNAAGNTAGTWSWEDDGTTPVGNVGNNVFKAKFTPDDTDNYNVVEHVNVTVTVGKATPAYTVPTGLNATYGDTLSSVALPDGWEWEDEGTTPVGNAGSNVFKAKFTPNDTDNYNVIEHVDVTVTVGKATPAYTVPTGLNATYGDTLSSVALPDGWEWEDEGTTPVGNAGSNVFKAKFTPDDTDNYNVVEHVDVTVTVGKAASSAATVTANEWTFDGTAHALLIVTGEAVGGTMKYVIGTATGPVLTPPFFSDTIPEASAADTYYVWYMVAGDENHNDTDPVLVTVTVAHDEALDAVIAAIDAIGPVTEVLADQKAKIDAARAGYNALTPEQQTLVTNYATLLGAEADYKALFVFDANTQITISGVEKYGETLTATAIDVPTFITDAVVRWYNEDGDLLGTGATYTLTAAEIGKSVRAELYSAEANDTVTSDFTGLIGKGVIKNYTLPTAAHITYPQTLAEATLTGGDTGEITGTWAWVTPDAQPTSAQSGSSFELTFTPTGIYADLYEGFTTRLAVIVDPAPFEPKAIEDAASGLTFDAEFAQNVEIELTDIAYSQSAYLALLRASKKDDSGMTRLVLLKTIVFTIDGEAADEAYQGSVTVTSYVGEKLAGQTVSVWFFIDGEPVNYVGTVGYDGVLVIDNVAL